MEPSFWDERYQGGGFFYGTAPNDFLVSQAERLTPGSRVLCLAEGEGRNAVYLAGLGHTVTAVDSSSVGLTKAAALAASHGLQLTTFTADLNDFAVVPGAWDAIVSVWCHVPEPLRRKVHAAAVQGLAPGGWFILEAYHPRQIGRGTGGPPTPDLMMTLPALRTELAGLDWHIAAESERDIREGAGHQGQSAVVQFAGQKPTGDSTC